MKKLTSFVLLVISCISMKAFAVGLYDTQPESQPRIFNSPQGPIDINLLEQAIALRLRSGTAIVQLSLPPYYHLMYRYVHPWTSSLLGRPFKRYDIRFVVNGTDHFYCHLVVGSDEKIAVINACNVNGRDERVANLEDLTHAELGLSNENTMTAESLQQNAIPRNMDLNQLPFSRTP